MKDCILSIKILDFKSVFFLIYGLLFWYSLNFPLNAYDGSFEVLKLSVYCDEEARKFDLLAHTKLSFFVKIFKLVKVNFWYLWEKTVEWMNLKGGLYMNDVCQNGVYFLWFRLNWVIPFGWILNRILKILRQT